MVDLAGSLAGVGAPWRDYDAIDAGEEWSGLPVLLSDK